LKYLVTLIAGLISGYMLYPAFNSSAVKTKLPEEKETKLQNFIDQEAKAFAVLKDADAKLKAAEAMYGKMMILFLADLGLKSSHQFVAASGPAAQAEAVESEKIDPLPTSQSAVESLIEKKEKVAKIEKQTDQQRYDDYRSAHYIEEFKNKQKRLLGQFVGTLRRQKPEERYDIVRMEFNLVQEDKKLDGGTLVTMTDHEGKEYSRNAGNGGNRALKANGKEVDSYYVEASPTSFFMISFKKYPRISGQYFEKGKLIGTLEMKKVSGDM